MDCMAVLPVAVFFQKLITLQAQLKLLTHMVAKPTLTSNLLVLSFVCLFFSWTTYLCSWGCFSLLMMRGIFLFIQTTPNLGDCYQISDTLKRTVVSVCCLSKWMQLASMQFLRWEQCEFMQNRWNCWEMFFSHNSYSTGNQSFLQAYVWCYTEQF